MNQTQLFWKEALEGINESILEKQAELDALLDQRADTQRRFNEASLWDVHNGNELVAEAMTWSGIQNWLKNAKMEGRVTSAGRMEIWDQWGDAPYRWGSAWIHEKDEGDES